MKKATFTQAVLVLAIEMGDEVQAQKDQAEDTLVSLNKLLHERDGEVEILEQDRDAKLEQIAVLQSEVAVLRGRSRDAYVNREAELQTALAKASRDLSTVTLQRDDALRDNKGWPEKLATMESEANKSAGVAYSRAQELAALTAKHEDLEKSYVGAEKEIARLEGVSTRVLQEAAATTAKLAAELGQVREKLMADFASKSDALARANDRIDAQDSELVMAIRLARKFEADFRRASKDDHQQKPAECVRVADAFKDYLRRWEQREWPPDIKTIKEDDK